MDRFLEGRSAIAIVAKIMAIIILLFICYENLTYEKKLEDLSAKITEFENAAKRYALPELVEGSAIKEAEEVRKIMFRVYITGAVNNPGIYDIEFGSRITDLIEMAGGAKESANLEIINLAAFVEDAAHIKLPYMPAEGEEGLVGVSAENMADTQPQATTPQYEEKPAYTGPVNINTASIERLMSLPGVGQAIASGIIQYRAQNGAFNSPEEIKNVSRIGDSLFNNIKDLITY